MENLPLEYNALGIDLGYFDTQGNMLKPLPQTANDSENISKKEQIEQLKAQVANLVGGLPMATKIEDLNKSIENLQGKKGILENINPDNEALLNSIFPKQTNLQADLEDLKPRMSDLSQQNKIY